MIGSEAHAKGFGILLAGGANLIRDPRAGRNFEYIGEDPLLSGLLAGRAIENSSATGIWMRIRYSGAIIPRWPRPWPASVVCVAGRSTKFPTIYNSRGSELA